MSANESQEFSLCQLQVYLEKNKVLLMLCDTIYGLVAKAPDGLEILQQIKGRPEDKPFLQLFGSIRQLEQSPWNLPPSALLAYWPGPLTCILASKSPGPLPPNFLANTRDSSQAVRIPRHELLQNLCLAVGSPLYSSSANRSGESTSQDPRKLLEVFAQEIAAGYVLPYFPELDEPEPPPQKSLASTIVDARRIPVKILRQGDLVISQFPQD